MAPSKRKAPAPKLVEKDSGWDVTGVFDTETTGLLKPDVSDLTKQPKIIEFAICELDRQYNVIDQHSWLINPGEPITEEITKITGLTNDDLKDKPRFIEVLPEIAKVFRRLDRVVAHNNPFDHGMLVNELKRLGLDHKFPYPQEWVCTVQLANELIYGRRARMIELYKDTMGRELDQTHRALDDVMALVDIIRERNW
jgi:DNA polymerase III epsilon subunit-like protein